MVEESDRDADGIARKGQPFNEETFHYFLALQRRRSERSGRPFLLVLVELKDPAGESLPIDAALAPKIMSGLRTCLRDTDFVGWYRKDRAAGAVLTELGDGSRTEASDPVSQRVRAAICEGLPRPVASGLQVPIYQFQPTLRS